MRSQRSLLTCILLAAFLVTVAAEEKPARQWGQRDLTPSVLSRVYKWLPTEERERLQDLLIEEVLVFLEKKRADSPFRNPWKRKELNKEPNADALLEILDEKKPEDRKQLMAEVPYIDAVRQLKAASSEGSGAAAPVMSIRVDEPEARNPGSNNGKITLRGTTTGVPDKKHIRLTAELRYPDRHSLPVLATGRAMIKNNKFKLDILLPRKEFLLGKYWVHTKLDFGKMRDRRELMVDGMLPVVTASRACFVGIDEKYRNSPSKAPEVIRQDIAIKTWYLALLEHEPIEVGGEKFPAASPDVLFWGEIERSLQTHRDANRAAKVLPAFELRDLINARADEMRSYFDPSAWRELLDDQVYPAIAAAEKLIADRRESVLRERFPEYSTHFVDRAGILRMLYEYAALRSKDLYDAAGQELPAVDQAQIRTRGRKPQDCLNLIQHSLNALYSRRSGISVAAITDLYRELDKLGERP